MTEIIINKRRDLNNNDGNIIVRYVDTNKDGDAFQSGKVNWVIKSNDDKSLHNILFCIKNEIIRNEMLEIWMGLEN